MTALANVEVPDTVSDDVPAVDVIVGLVPFITSEPTVNAPFLISNVPLLIVRSEILLPNVPKDDNAKVPPLILVVPA